MFKFHQISSLRDVLRKKRKKRKIGKRDVLFLICQFSAISDRITIYLPKVNRSTRPGHIGSIHQTMGAISKMCSSDRRCRALKRGPQWRVPLGQNDPPLCIYIRRLGFAFPPTTAPQVLVLNVAMNSSETAMFLIILTNNFGHHEHLNLTQMWSKCASLIVPLPLIYE